MNKEPMIKITEPEVVSKIEPIENGATGIIIYNYDKCHIYYKGIDLGSFEELLNVKKYITDLQKEAEQGDHYKHLYSEVKKQKDDVVEYIKYLIKRLEEFDIPKRKETGAFWYQVMGELEEVLRIKVGEIDNE